MMAWMLACRLAVAHAAAPSATTFLVPIGASATVVFDATVRMHFSEAPICWGGSALHVPGPRTLRHEIDGMLVAADRFWPGNDLAPYRMLYLMITESNGGTRNTAKPSEQSYGPWCATVDEARQATVFGIGCPRRTADIVEKLQADPEWSALVAASAIYCCDRAAGGDSIRGTLLYKFGGAGLRRALDQCKGCPLTELVTWRKTARARDRVMCLREHVLAGSVCIPCACEVNE